MLTEKVYGIVSISLSKAIWGKVSPFALYRKLPESTVLKSIGRYVRRMQPGRTEEENVAMENYLFQILLRPGTTEYALFQQFDYGLHAYKPLAADDRLGGEKTLPFAVSIVFGDRDWMDTRGAAKIIKNNKFYESG